MQDALNAKPIPGMEFVSLDEAHRQVYVGLFLALSKQQRELDARFGKGTVRLEGVLKPID